MLTKYIRKNTGGSYSKTGAVIRKPSRTKKGIMIAIPVDYDKIRIGWSLCNFSMEDEFSDLGMKIAIERAETSSTLPPAHSMVEELKKFIGRVKTYYKDKEVEVTFPLEEDQKDKADSKSLIEMAFEDRMALEA
jgi:hypothetical protein